MERIWEEYLSLQAPSNSGHPVARWTADRASGAPDCYLSVSSRRGRFPFNRYFFAPIKDLGRDFVEPVVDIVSRGEHQLSVRLEAPAYFVHLEVPHEATRFSDNYFDLAPGEGREVLVTNKQRQIRPEMVRVKWR